MTCGAINPGNQYLWLTAAGIFFGGGLRFLINSRRRRKPALGLVFISIAVLSLLLSVYLSGFSFARLYFRLYWLGACVLLGYLGFFFWRAAGIPLVFLLILSVALVWSAFYGWQCSEPGSEICRFNIISVGEDFLKVQYETADGITGLDRIDGKQFYPELTILSVPEFLFILNENGLFRFSGFSSRPDNTPVSRFGPVSRLILSLPGAGVSTVEVPLNASPSVEYSLFLNDEGVPEIIKCIE